MGWALAGYDSGLHSPHLPIFSTKSRQLRHRLATIPPGTVKATEVRHIPLFISRSWTEREPCAHEEMTTSPGGKAITDIRTVASTPRAGNISSLERLERDNLRKYLSTRKYVKNKGNRKQPSVSHPTGTY
jgi:hypothetical protein